MIMRGRALAAVVLAVALGGCSSAGQAAEPAEPVLPSALTKVDMKTFTLPLDEYAPTAEQSLTITKARNILAVRCLKTFGFSVQPPDVEPLPVRPMEGRYLLTDEAHAAAYGYKMPEIDGRRRAPEPPMSPAAEAAMTGRGASSIGGVPVPEGGCMGDAYRQLGIAQGPASGGQLVQRLNAETFDRMQADSRVVAGNRRWSECMQQQGYHYPDPERANNDPTFSGTVASPREIATAVADVRCKKQADLTDLMAAVETAYQRRAVERNAPALDRYRQQAREQIRRAAGVVAGGS